MNPAPSVRQGGGLNDERSVDNPCSTNNRDDQRSCKDATPKIWKCGEPYQFPIPKPDGDPWQVLLAPLMEKDKAQCDAWKDEVQNLLIFAGLFSAVVTAFIVESYKGLQQDPSDIMILLLSRIAANLESPSNNGTLADTSFPEFSPSPSTVRINIFLFISLILSLATVLIGIISLQWLREHQSYTGGLNPQNTFATIHMRSEAIERWRVPEIFSALPLLLQSALVLFFIGIIDFLRDISFDVLVPVAVFVGLTLLFLLLTTTLPTLQAFILQYPCLKVNDQVPVQCPYKSPQAKAFRLLVTSSKMIFIPLSLAFVPAYWTLMRLYLLPEQFNGFYVIRRLKTYCKTALTKISVVSRPSASTSSKFDRGLQSLFRLDNSGSWSSFDYMTPYIFDFWHLTTSSEFDVMWMSIRDNYFQSLCSEDSWLYRSRFDHQDHGGIFDATLGICEELTKDEINMNTDFEAPIFTAYHCALDLSSVNHLHGDELLCAMRTRNQYIATFLGYSQSTPLTPFPKLLNDITSDLLIEENAFVILDHAYEKLSKMQLSSLRVSQHLAEISFRLLGYLYSCPQAIKSPVAEAEHTVPDIIFNAEELYIMNIYDSIDQPFTLQWALTLHTYFKVWDDPNIGEVDFERSFHTHPFLPEYVWNFWKQVDIEYANGVLHPNTLKQTSTTFRLIDRILSYLLHTNHADAFDCLFYSASLYAQNCRRRLPDNFDLGAEITFILPTLMRCKGHIESRGSRFEYIYGRGEYNENQKMILFSGEWWDILISSDMDSNSSRPSTSPADWSSPTEHIVSTPDNAISSNFGNDNTQFPQAPYERQSRLIPWTSLHVDSIV